MSNQPFRLIIDKTLQFMFLFTNAEGFYISARYNLQHGWIVAGCTNAHQAIELYMKAILKLNHEQQHGHNLVSLLKKYERREPYFSSLLQNKTFADFLQELSEAYFILRYGEAGAESRSSEIIQILDELAYNLRTIYLRKIKSPSTKICLPKDTKQDFLRENKFFTEQDITNNLLAQLGLPTDFELPDNFFAKTEGQ